MTKKKTLVAGKKLKTEARPRRRVRRTPARVVVALRAAVMWVIRFGWGFGWRAALVLGLILSGSVFYYYVNLVDIEELYDGRTYGATIALDRYNEPFAWRGYQYGGPVTAGSVSPHLVNAILSMEDHRFYKHFGLSLQGIMGAILINLREGRGAFEGHGGSSITQQTAKMLCFGETFDPQLWESQSRFEQECRKTTLWRKFKEIPYSLALELRYTKDEILTLYLNRVYLGASATGVEAASQRYFDIPAHALTIQQSAMLAGMLAAPSRYAPTKSLDLAQQRAGIVIDQMVRRGFLSEIDAAVAKDMPAGLSSAAEQRTGGYFVDWVVENGPGFLNRNQTDDFVIQTTYDGDIQKAVDDAVKDVFATKVKDNSNAQVAVVVMSPDGAVRALLGGRDIEAVGLFNRAVNADRQTGSLFKPFVYAAAVEWGMNYDDIITDSPITITIPGQEPWSPKNYNNKSWGDLTLAEALAHSVNTIAVRISEAIGRDLVIETARQLGIRSPIAPGPAIALGTSEATLLEMTGAYAGIRNGGWRVQPYGLRSIKMSDTDTSLMEHKGNPGIRALSGPTSRQLVYMMHKVVREGTGRRADVASMEVAGKTGTTQESRDAWFIGFSGYYVVGVWMGYDNNRPLQNVTGGGLPAEIWHEVMLRIHEGLEPRPLPFPVHAERIG